DANWVPDLHHGSRAKVPAVALLAHAKPRLACERSPQVDFQLTLHRGEPFAHILVDLFVSIDDDLARVWIDDGQRGHPSYDLIEPHRETICITQIFQPDPSLGTAVLVEH